MHHLRGWQLGNDGVREHGNLERVLHEIHSDMGTRQEPLTFVAFMFFKSIPTSRVTPSPNRRFAAATCNISRGDSNGK